MCRVITVGSLQRPGFLWRKQVRLTRFSGMNVRLLNFNFLETYWQKCACSVKCIKWAAALCFWVTWPCLLNSLHHSAVQLTVWRTGWQICELVCERVEYPAITGRALKIKPVPADCMSQYRSTGTWLHYPLCSGNTDSLENLLPSSSECLSIAHIFAWLLHTSRCFLKYYISKELKAACRHFLCECVWIVAVLKCILQVVAA